MTEAPDSTSSIAGIIQLAGRITRLSYEYACNAKTVTLTQKEYLQGLSAFMEVLLRVEQVISTHPASPDGLDDCYKQLSGLDVELRKRKLQSMRPFQIEELRFYIDMLGKFRSMFSGFLSSILETNATTIDRVEHNRRLLLTCIPSARLPLQRPTPCPGTGGWFLASDAVKQWIDRSSTVLWVLGSPGVGKSHLASTLIDHLLAQQSQNFILGYFFYDFSRRDQQSALHMFHILLRQLIKQSNGDMLAIIKESIKDPITLLTIEGVADLIARAGSVQPIYLILDGCDELDDQTELLSHFVAFAEAGIQVLITSRDPPHMPEKMDVGNRVEVTASDEDLRLYVRSCVRRGFAGVFYEGMVEQIVSIGDSFLVVRLILDELLNLTSISEIQTALSNQPRSLQNALERALGRVDSQSTPIKSLARRLISWVICAKRALKLEEIMSAFSAGQGDFQLESNANADILLQACAGLVVIQSDDTIGLVHRSAYEFLRQHVSQETDIDIARTCLQHLSMELLGLGPCKDSIEMTDRFKELPSLDYSAKYWGHHISDSCELSLEPMIMTLLKDKHVRSSAFKALHYQQDLPNELFESLLQDQNEIHIAAYWGLINTATKLLAEGVSVSAIDSQKCTPLHWACLNNHVSMADLLVRNGADVNSQDNQGWTPLFLAALNGNLDLVRLLLSNGANCHIRSTIGWTALHWAISGGHSSIVEELLTHHSQYQIPEPALCKMTIKEITAYAQATSPILLAAETGNQDIFNSLVPTLEISGGKIKHVQFNMIWPGKQFDTPVANNPWRIMSKQERYDGPKPPILRLLPSDPDDERGKRYTPTQWKSALCGAAIRDQEFLSAEMLVETGADVNYGKLLHGAAFRADPRYAQLLVENGADLAVTEVCGRTALHQAIMNGFVNTVTSLINAGADVNQPFMTDEYHRMLQGLILTRGYAFSPSLKGATPLMQACGLLQETNFRRRPTAPRISLYIMQLLLSTGADPSRIDGFGRSVLHYAVLQPFLPVIRLLVESGTVIDAVDQDGCTPFHYLARCEEKEYDIRDLEQVVYLLLTGKKQYASGDVLNQPACKRDPAQPAFQYPVRKRFGRQKFQSSSILGKESDEGLTPLMMALEGSRWKMIRIFLQHGATMPSGLDLGPILDDAIRDLQTDMADLLILHGTRPSERAVVILIDSFFAKIKDAEHLREDMDRRFKHILTSIVSAGADVNSYSCFMEGGAKDTPLTLAAHIPGSRDILHNLLGLGADLYHPSRTFDTILTAAVFGDDEDLKCLLDHATTHPDLEHWSRHLKEISDSVDPITRICICLAKTGRIDNINKQGQTLLHLAAEHGNVSLIMALISCNARTDIPNADGWLAIHSAGFAQQTAALQILLSHIDTTAHSSLSILQKLNDRKRTMLETAVEKNNPSMVSLLLQHGSNPNHQNPISKTPPLYSAAENGHTEIVSLLIHHGAHIEAENLHGSRALHVACHQGHVDIVKTLIEAGADVHVPAVKMEDGKRIIEPNTYDPHGGFTKRAIHFAVLSGNPAVVELLLERGVDVHVSMGLGYFNKGDITPLHLALDAGNIYVPVNKALSEGRLQIAQMLVGRGAMVRGVIRDYSLQDLLKFRDFPDLWDALVAGDSEES